MFFFQAEDGIRGGHVTGVQTCALPIWRTYVQYKPFYKKHTASAPGDAPNRDTGQLGSSLIVTRSGSTSAEVLANVEYAAYLELGTRNMAARPFMTPAVEQERPNYERGLRELAKRAAK